MQTELYSRALLVEETPENSVANDGNRNNYTELDLTLNVNSTDIWQKYMANILNAVKTEE